MAVQFSSLLKKQKKLKKGVKTALTQLKSQESILEGPEGLTEQKTEALASFIPKIGYYDTKTGEGSGLVGEIGSAGGAFSQAHKSYKESESVFAETKSGKAMASFKEKYKTYDPQAAKSAVKHYQDLWKKDENYQLSLDVAEGRKQLNERLKDFNMSGNLFSAEVDEEGNYTFTGSQDIYDLFETGWTEEGDKYKQKFGKDFTLRELLATEASMKKYYDSSYGKYISESESDFSDQSALAYGPRNVRRAGPSEYQQYLDKSSGFKSTMDTQSELIKTKSAELGIDPETGSKTGSGVYGEMSEVESEWDTKIGKQEKEISEIYRPAHTGAKTALTALTARIKKYELLGLADQEPKKSSTYKKPQMGYGAGYLRRSA